MPGDHFAIEFERQIFTAADLGAFERALKPRIGFQLLFQERFQPLQLRLGLLGIGDFESQHNSGRGQPIAV